jgi:SAM-dependent methyltransferase
MDAQRLEFADQTFDVLVASDVLEHLADERVALEEWRRVLAPGGSLLVFVPAFSFLWSEHDVANRHYRRYRLEQLSEVIKDVGFRLERKSYWNALLFPAVALVRGMKRLTAGRRLSIRNSPAGDLFIPPEFANRMLLAFLRLENILLLSKVRWPVGVSAMAIATSPRADQWTEAKGGRRP